MYVIPWRLLCSSCLGSILESRRGKQVITKTELHRRLQVDQNLPGLVRADALQRFMKWPRGALESVQQVIAWLFLLLLYSFITFGISHIDTKSKTLSLYHGSKEPPGYRIMFPGSRRSLVLRLVRRLVPLFGSPDVFVFPLHCL